MRLLDSLYPKERKLKLKRLLNKFIWVKLMLSMRTDIKNLLIKLLVRNLKRKKKKPKREDAMNHQIHLKEEKRMRLMLKKMRRQQRLMLKKTRMKQQEM